MCARILSGTLATAAVGYGKDGREITRTDIARVVALKSIAKLQVSSQLSSTDL